MRPRRLQIFKYIGNIYASYGHIRHMYRQISPKLRYDIFYSRGAHTRYLYLPEYFSIQRETAVERVPGRKPLLRPLPPPSLFAVLTARIAIQGDMDNGGSTISISISSRAALRSPDVSFTHTHTRAHVADFIHARAIRLHTSRARPDRRNDEVHSLSCISRTWTRVGICIRYENLYDRPIRARVRACAFTVFPSHAPYLKTPHRKTI